MADQTLPDMLARIDAALVRIEASIPRLSETPASAPDKPTMAALVARHETLRESVASSLVELDNLIARLER